MPRLCACGCGRSLEGRRATCLYAEDACRARAFKVRQGGNGQNGSDAAPESPEDAKRRAGREAKARARAEGVIASDVRVSFERAVRVLAGKLESDEFHWFEDDAACAAAAREWLAEALPARLREHV